MKINPIMAIVAFAISALVAYGFYAGNAGTEFVWALTIGSGISIFLTIGALLAVGIKSDSRLGVNIKIVATLFFVMLLIEHIIFAFVPMRIAPYIIITGILLIVYFIICYGIAKSNG